MMVVVHHTTLLLGERLNLPVENWLVGSAGVDIFFIISGFVMTISSAPLQKAKHPARIFLARRLERVVPLYWLITTLKVVLVLAAPALVANSISTFQIVGSYLFAPLQDPVLIVGWTLNFEMGFYALFALALALRTRVVTVVAPVLIGIVLAAHLFPRHTSWALAFYGQSIVLEFLFGILLALAIARWGRPPRWLSLVLILTGFAVLFGIRWWLIGEWRILFWSLPAFAIVTGALGIEGWLRAPRFLQALGDASYSIYLVHTLVLPLIGFLLARWGASTIPVPLVLALSAVLSAGAGWAVYLLIELPMMRWFKGRRKTAIPAAA